MFWALKLYFSALLLQECMGVNSAKLCDELEKLVERDQVNSIAQSNEFPLGLEELNNWSVTFRGSLYSITKTVNKYFFVVD